MVNLTGLFRCFDQRPERDGVADLIEKAIVALAHRQHGYVTRAQLLGLGLTRHAIEYRVAITRLIPVYAGIYAVGHVPANPIDRAAGAILTCGPKAALSHASAATLWGWLRPWRTPFHVTAPTRHRRAGIIVHLSTSLIRADFRTQRGHPRHEPGPDGSRRRPDPRPAPAAPSARRRPAQLPPARGAERRARALPPPPRRRPTQPLPRQQPRPEPLGLGGEFPEFCARYGLPQPVINARVHGYEVDAWFPEHRVAVELDGWEFHRDRGAFEHDRDKDAHLLQFGIETVRITWSGSGQARGARQIVCTGFSSAGKGREGRRDAGPEHPSSYVPLKLH